MQFRPLRPTNQERYSLPLAVPAVDLVGREALREGVACRGRSEHGIVRPSLSPVLRNPGHASGLRLSASDRRQCSSSDRRLQPQASLVDVGSMEAAQRDSSAPRSTASGNHPDQEDSSAVRGSLSPRMTRSKASQHPGSRMSRCDPACVLTTAVLALGLSLSLPSRSAAPADRSSSLQRFDDLFTQGPGADGLPSSCLDGWMIRVYPFGQNREEIWRD